MAYAEIELADVGKCLRWVSQLNVGQMGSITLNCLRLESDRRLPLIDAYVIPVKEPLEQSEEGLESSEGMWTHSTETPINMVKSDRSAGIRANNFSVRPEAASCSSALAWSERRLPYGVCTLQLTRISVCPQFVQLQQPMWKGSTLSELTNLSHLPN